MKEIVNERNAKTVRVKLYDEATGLPVLPTTLEWRMKCVSSNRVLSDYAPATVETVYDQIGQLSEYRSNIPIPASLNAMQNPCARQEERVIDIVADRGLETEWSTEVTYYVRKRRGRT
jgi:hypothetical protein